MSDFIERRRHRTWGERFFIEPVYFWFDLYGPDGRPSHHKVLSAIGFAAGLFASLRWGAALAAADGTGISWPYVFLVLGVLSVPMGKNVFVQFLSALAGRRINGNGGGGAPPPSTGYPPQEK